MAAVASACTAGCRLNAENVGAGTSARTAGERLTAKTVAVAPTARTVSASATSASSLRQRRANNSCQWLASTLPSLRETILKKSTATAACSGAATLAGTVDAGQHRSAKCSLALGWRSTALMRRGWTSESGRAFIHFYLVYVSILFSSAARNQHPPHHPILVQQVGSGTGSLSTSWVGLSVHRMKMRTGAYLSRAKIK